MFSMASCFGVTTFADNFYKQTAILLAAAAGPAFGTKIQGIATVLFSLPFIFCSAWAGWLADRFVKKNIMIFAKVLETVALCVGAFALIGANWYGVLAVIFIMGLQSTLFSPSLNGSIPELFESQHVPRVNAWVKLTTTAAVLAGMACAGVLMDLRPGGILPDFGLADNGPRYGRFVAGISIVCISFIGFWPTLFIPKRPAARKKSGQKFPWLGPVDSWHYFLECRKDKQLYLILLAEAAFYGIAVLASMSIVNLAKGFGYSDTMSSLLSASLMIGIAVGAVIAGRQGTESWKRLLVPAASAMGVCLLLTSVAAVLPSRGSTYLPNPQLAWLFIILPVTGIFGGIYLIPLTSAIQLRPAEKDKGKVIGVSNFLTFVAMGVFGLLFLLIGLMPPALTFAFYGVCALVFMNFIVGPRMRKFDEFSIGDQPPGVIGRLLRIFLSLRYKVTETGLDRIKTGRSMLFLPNHPAMVDPIITYSRLAGVKPRPLADAHQMDGLLKSLAGKAINAITLPDLSRNGRAVEEKVKETMDRVIKALRAGDNVLLYPSGRLYRSGREVLGGNSGVARILAEVPEARVILARITGLWGSRFSYAPGRAPQFFKELGKGILRLFANGVLFTPRRKVAVEFEEPADLPKGADKRELNLYLERFYNEAERPAEAVPNYFWQGSKPRRMPEPVRGGSNDAADVPENVKEEVGEILREAAGLAPGDVLEDTRLLSADLGVDSLTLMEVATAIESRFGHPVTSLTALVSVSDCYLAAVGRLPEEAEAAVGIPAKQMALWESLSKGGEAGTRLGYNPEMVSMAHGFLELARKGPGRPLLADKTGVRTRKDVLTAALALSAYVKTLPGKRVGIMLPSAPAATVVWLATQLAGKTPVMLNWTVGERNMRHCLELAEISHCLTASALLDQLAKQGADMSVLPVEWVRLEAVGKSLGALAKAGAWLKSTLHCSGISRIDTGHVPEVAVILFTSGSEAAPKGVPLTHKNIMCTARDIMEVFTIMGNDSVLSMLPPFHSFGVLVGIAMPMAAGLPVVMYPNPTDSGPLVDMVRNYRVTFMAATPTFLEGMLQKAEGTDDLKSLRLMVTGAEACPERVFKSFQQVCPGVPLCEAYGITECAPGIACNRPDNIRLGTVGYALPSVTLAVRREDGGRAAPGERGMLLVRGDNVFTGYLGEVPSPFTEFEGESWYATGDLVTMAEDGRITFAGRLKRFVKVGGEMISLPQMEAVLLEGMEASRDTGALALPEDGRPYLAIEARETPGGNEILLFTTVELDVRRANDLLKTAGLSSLYTIRRQVKVEEIPLLGTGKTDYRALKRLVA